MGRNLCERISKVVIISTEINGEDRRESVVNNIATTVVVVVVVGDTLIALVNAEDFGLGLSGNSVEVVRASAKNFTYLHKPLAGADGLILA